MQNKYFALAPPTPSRNSGLSIGQDLAAQVNSLRSHTLLSRNDNKFSSMVDPSIDSSKNLEKMMKDKSDKPSAFSFLKKEM